ncbi:SART-1 protein [Gaertneriomyces semiglobifer]|nr:SART-1 protein [Gaertneriomyces semiglobifer]
MTHNDEAQSSQQEISLSIEETNALRIKLGLKPLAEDSKTDTQKEAEANYARHQQDEVKKVQRKELIDKIQKEKAKVERSKKLTGPTLADEDESIDDSLAWIQRQKEAEQRRKAEERRKQIDLAKKKAREIEEMDSAYTSADLKGLTIAHDIEQVAATGETILTLKDSEIGEEDDEGDVLINTELTEIDRGRQNIENRKKKLGYNVYDDEDFDCPGNKRGILSQYDDEIDGPTQKGFTISASGTVNLEKKKKVSQTIKGQLDSLDYQPAKQVHDYYTTEESVSFKKPKKKKKSRSGRKRSEENEGEEGTASQFVGSHNMEVDAQASDQNSAVSNPDIDDINLVDDDDLQAAIARTRRLTVQRRVNDVQAIADAAREIKDEETTPAGGVVLSATSEFVATLPTAPVVRAPEPPRQSRPAIVDEPEVPLGESMDADVPDETPDIEGTQPHEDEILDDPQVASIVEEPLVGSSLGAAISLLSQKGFLDKATPEHLERERKQAEKRKWLAEQKKRDLLRELEKEKEKQRNRERNQKGGNRHDYDLDRDWYREEQEARQAERERIREIEERFKHYTPDVNLVYHDEYGRNLNAKEAFRQLSHKFHGKASGKMKTEKRLKKIEDELRMQQMSSIDTPLGTANALLERTKAVGAAHVVLSVGNRGYVRL